MELFQACASIKRIFSYFRDTLRKIDLRQFRTAKKSFFFYFCYSFCQTDSGQILAACKSIISYYNCTRNINFCQTRAFKCISVYPFQTFWQVDFCQLFTRQKSTVFYIFQTFRQRNTFQIFTALKHISVNICNSLAYFNTFYSIISSYFLQISYFSAAFDKHVSI